MEKRELREINLDYLDKINMPDNKFGIEIEFSGALFKDVNKKLDELFGYKTYDAKVLERIELEKAHYERWRLVNDSTVQDSTEYMGKKGGEINTPIMRNEKKYWQELKQVCEMLRKMKNIKIDDRCAVHIHTEKSIFEEIEEYKNLLKLFILNEDIIYRFGYGETCEPRRTLLTFAKPFSAEYNLPPEIILKKIDKIETPEELIKLLRYERKYGLNLTNIIKIKRTENDIIKPTIELRIFNGTLNDNILQNYVRFKGYLLDYCKKENFDIEYNDYQIKNYKPLYINESIPEKPEKADRFFKQICKKNELDRLKLLKQYYKEYNENDIEKSIHL